MLLLKKILGFFFDDWRGQVAAVVGGIIVLITGFAWDQRNVGARNALSDVNKAASELARKSREARAGVDPADADRRLRREYCGDC